MNMKVVAAVLAGAGILGAAMILSSRTGPKTDSAFEETANIPTDTLTNNIQPVPGGTSAREPELQPEKIPANNPPPATTPRPKPKPKPAAAREVTIPSGTIIQASLQNTLTSHESTEGDAFTLKVTEPVIVNGYTAIPAGATVNGIVVSAKPSGKVKGRGEITLAFKSITDVNGHTHPIEADTYYGQAEAVTDRDAAVIAGGAGTGAIIGGIVGGKKGALLGGLIGGAAGTGTVLATKGPEVKLTPGSVFAIHLTSSVEVPAGSRS